MGYRLSEEECAKLEELTDAEGDGEVSLKQLATLLLFNFLKIEDTEVNIYEIGNFGNLPPLGYNFLGCTG